MVEIKIPEAKPAYEWVNGRALQKVIPKQRHAIAQTRFAAALDRWAFARRAGRAGTEWRFWIEPPGEVRRPLVPDVAFLSYVRLPYHKMERAEEPHVAPDVVVEVKSSGDRTRDIDEKVRVYLAAGAGVVFLVDPRLRRVTVCDLDGRRQLREGDVISHQTLSRFRLPVSMLFETPKPRMK